MFYIVYLSINASELRQLESIIFFITFAADNIYSIFKSKVHCLLYNPKPNHPMILLISFLPDEDEPVP